MANDTSSDPFGMALIIKEQTAELERLREDIAWKAKIIKAADVEMERLRGLVPRALTTWQPIETAPNDGTLVDLWFECDDGTGWRTIEAYFEEGAWWCGDHRIVCSGEPKFWMRSPADPSQSSGEPTEKNICLGWTPTSRIAGNERVGIKRAPTWPMKSTRQQLWHSKR